MISAHDAVTFILVYLAIGSLVWFALFCCGVVHESFRRHQTPMLSVVLASFGVVVAWPILAWVLLSAMWQGARR